MNDACVIGVDLGGTNVRAQAVFHDGSGASDRFENPSHAQQGTDAILEQVALTIRQVISNSKSRPQAVGLAIPGHVADDEGIVKWAPNFGETIDGVFHYWENVSIRPELEKLCNLPIVMANDANAAAMGEYAFGSGKNNANCLAMVTLGTGIGGGVVLGKPSVQGGTNRPLLLLGGNQGGVEFGHMVIQKDGIDCNAGTYGTLEGYCQRDAIIRRTTHRLRRNRTSIIRDLVDGDLAKVTPREIATAAEQGDQLALQIWAEFGEFLGIGLVNIINIFAPDVLAIGGQISKAWKYFSPAMMVATQDSAVPSLFNDCRIVQAEQSEDAGLLGAAALAFGKTGL